MVRLSLANLMTFPWIAEAVAAGRLALQGYWFDVHTGVLASVGPTGSSRWIEEAASLLLLGEEVLQKARNIGTSSCTARHTRARSIVGSRRSS